MFIINIIIFFFFFFNSQTQYRFSIEWNYFVENHGKSICDTHFSFVSKAIKQWSKQPGNFVKSTNHLITAITETFKFWKNQTKEKNKHIKNNKQNKSFFNIYINKITIPKYELNKQIMKFDNIKSYYHFKNINNELFVSVLTNKHLIKKSFKNKLQKRDNNKNKIGFNTPISDNNYKKNTFDLIKKRKYINDNNNEPINKKQKISKKKENINKKRKKAPNNQNIINKKQKIKEKEKRKRR